ncbi:MAG: S8 family peptidase [Bacteroidota bacterium]
MKKIAVLFTFLSFKLFLFTQNTDSVYYYRENGEQEWWYIQKDVYSFRMQNGLAYNDPETDMSIVDALYQRQNSSRKINVMEFRPESNDNQREVEKNKPRTRPGFECEFLVLSKDKNALKAENKWKTTDDLLLVVFRNPGISSSEVAQFMNRNDLLPYHTPSNSLPHEGTWTYAFRLKPTKCGQTNTIQKAKEVFEQESALVKVCSPNLRLIEPACDYLPENDNYSEENRFWWIDNNGGEVANDVNGTADADVDACECWEAGFTGKNVKIGVIDFNGFDFNHEDMQGVFLNGWNTITNNLMPATGSVYAAGYLDKGHGMAVSGLIGAQNNDIGTVGIAYDAEIYPVLTDGEFLQLAIGIQKSVENSCDIINMSFITQGVDVDVIHNEIIQGYNLGRWNDELNQYLGIVFVGGVGNNTWNVVTENNYIIFEGYRTYPASYDEVIGVGNSNPFDKRHFLNFNMNQIPYSPNLPYSIGSNGGQWYEVVAPGTNLMLVDLIGSNGFSVENYDNNESGEIWGSSFSTPIVSGISAILLEKNKNLNNREIRDLIIRGAEKVHPELYNYAYYEQYPQYPELYYPGVSNQMFHGRVSCINSLDLTGYFGIDEKELIQVQLKNNTLYNFSNQNYVIELRSLDGRLIQRENVKANQSVDLKNCENGLYTLSYFDEYNNLLKFEKIIR